MNFSLVSAGRGADVVAHIKSQLQGIVDSTYQTEASKGTATAAAGVLIDFASQFLERLVFVSASGHVDSSPTGYGSCEIKVNTLLEAPKAS